MGFFQKELFMKLWPFFHFIYLFEEYAHRLSRSDGCIVCFYCDYIMGEGNVFTGFGSLPVIKEYVCEKYHF